jgi:hypothetical protein
MNRTIKQDTTVCTNTNTEKSSSAARACLKMGVKAIKVARQHAHTIETICIGERGCAYGSGERLMALANGNFSSGTVG